MARARYTSSFSFVSRYYCYDHRFYSLRLRLSPSFFIFFSLYVSPSLLPLVYTRRFPEKLHVQATMTLLFPSLLLSLSGLPFCHRLRCVLARLPFFRERDFPVIFWQRLHDASSSKFQEADEDEAFRYDVFVSCELVLYS